MLLGILQGLTEFLPVSSTAHLTIAGRLMGLISPLHPEHWTAFIAIIQLGTAAAVVLYFGKDLGGISHSMVTDLVARKPLSSWDPLSRLGMLTLLGTLPVVILGVTFEGIIEGKLTKRIDILAASLILFALFLWWAERVGSRRRSVIVADWKDALIVGFAQALALLPGSSRSGVTIAAALFLGFRREAAARFSFLLSIPAVVTSGCYELWVVRGELADVGFFPLVIATGGSFLVGYLTIAFLLRYLESHSTIVFIIYRILLGICLLGGLAAGIF